MLTAHQLAAARAAQLSIMHSTLRINAPGGPRWDPNTRTEVDTPGELIYEGVGRIQPDNQRAKTITAGGEGVVIVEYVGAIPWYRAGIAPGHIVTLVEPATGAGQPGKRWVITEAEYGDGPVTARRFRAREIGTRTRPRG